MPPHPAMQNDSLSVSDECVQEVRALRVAVESVANSLSEIVGFGQGASAKVKKYGFIALSVLATTGVIGGPIGAIIKQWLAVAGVAH